MNEYKKMSLWFLFAMPCSYLLSVFSDAFIHWRAPLFNPAVWHEAARVGLLVVIAFLLIMFLLTWFHKN